MAACETNKTLGNTHHCSNGYCLNYASFLLTDPTLTPENIAAVLEQVEDWEIVCNDLLFPTSMPKIMLAKVIIDRYDIASWLEISSRLFSYGQERAVKAAKKYLPVSFQGTACVWRRVPIHVY